MPRTLLTACKSDIKSYITLQLERNALNMAELEQRIKLTSKGLTKDEKLQLLRFADKLLEQKGV